MSKLVFVGMDDTDDAEGPGTGRRARQLGREIVNSGLGVALGVTRHQLLVDARIPYTSHNSALCLAIESGAALSEIADASRHFLASCCADGSDPGLCVARAASVANSVIEFGYHAKQAIVLKDEAIHLAAEAGLILEELAGTGGGVIGALAAVGLRTSGEDGRFVELPGIRDLEEDDLPVRDILGRTGVEAVVDEGGGPVPADDLIHFGGWLRPTLRQGSPVLVVCRLSDEETIVGGGEDAAQKGWVTVEHKHKNNRNRHDAGYTLLGHGSHSGSGMGRAHRRH